MALLYNYPMAADAIPTPWWVQSTQVIFYLTPVVVFLITGFFAAWRFNIFRTAKPSIRIDMEVSSRSCSSSYNVLSAVALLVNTSRVRAQCNSLQWVVRVLAPFDDHVVEAKLAEYQHYLRRVGPPVEFPWNIQYRIINDDPGIALEPGESNVVDLSVALPDWIQAVDVRCTMVLPKGRRGPVYVWNNRCIHDMSRKVNDGE